MVVKPIGPQSQRSVISLRHRHPLQPRLQAEVRLLPAAAQETQRAERKVRDQDSPEVHPGGFFQGLEVYLIT